MRIQSPLLDLTQQLRNFVRSTKIAVKAFSMCPLFICEGAIIRPITRTFDTNDGSWMEEDWRITKVEFPYFWATPANPNSCLNLVLGYKHEDGIFVTKFDVRKQTFMCVDNS